MGPVNRVGRVDLGSKIRAITGGHIVQSRAGRQDKPSSRLIDGLAAGKFGKSLSHQLDCRAHWEEPPDIGFSQEEHSKDGTKAVSNAEVRYDFASGTIL
jgi:hypothetical protein